MQTPHIYNHMVFNDKRSQKKKKKKKKPQLQLLRSCTVLHTSSVPTDIIQTKNGETISEWLNLDLRSLISRNTTLHGKLM